MLDVSLFLLKNILLIFYVYGVLPEYGGEGALCPQYLRKPEEGSGSPRTGVSYYGSELLRGYCELTLGPL